MSNGDTVNLFTDSNVVNNNNENRNNFQISTSINHIQSSSSDK